MDKPFYSDGFTLIEVLIAMVVLSSLFIFSYSCHKMYSFDFYQFYDKYLFVKSNAMVLGNHEEIVIDDKIISFNQNGNVNQANTVEFDIGNKKRKFTIQLGSGVLIEKE